MARTHAPLPKQSHPRWTDHHQPGQALSEGILGTYYLIKALRDVMLRPPGKPPILTCRITVAEPWGIRARPARGALLLIMSIANRLAIGSRVRSATPHRWQPGRENKKLKKRPINPMHPEKLRMIRIKRWVIRSGEGLYGGRSGHHEMDLLRRRTGPAGCLRRRKWKWWSRGGSNP